MGRVVVVVGFFSHTVGGFFVNVGCFSPSIVGGFLVIVGFFSPIMDGVFVLVDFFLSPSIVGGCFVFVGFFSLLLLWIGVLSLLGFSLQQFQQQQLFTSSGQFTQIKIKKNTVPLKISFLTTTKVSP